MNKRMCFALIGVSSIVALASSSVLAEAPAVEVDSMTGHGASGAPIVRTAPVRLRERSPEQVDTNYGWRPNTDVDRAPRLMLAVGFSNLRSPRTRNGWPCLCNTFARDTNHAGSFWKNART